LLLALIPHAERPERILERFREFGVPEPTLVRARSAAQALSPEVPLFAGLRALAPGADEDSLVLLATMNAPKEEVERLISRIQLEMDADDPPMGKLYALSVLAPS
jgi:hypothetical protein